MDSRKVKICYFLAQNKSSTLSDISKRFNKSKRTIRNDIDEINLFLKNKNKAKIYTENNIVKLETNSTDIFSLLNNLSYSEYYLDAIERRVVIILFGLIKNDNFTIKELSSFMHVSRSTVINDLDSIKKFIDSYNYQLITEPSVGTHIEELENSYKFELVNDLISFDINNISRFFNQKDLPEIINNKSINNNYIKNLSNIINKVEKETDSSLTDYSFRLLKYFISIYCHNLDLSFKLERNTLGEMEFSNHLINSLEDYLDIRFSEEDENNISRFIQKLNFSEKSYDSKDKLKAQIVTGNFIDEVSMKLGINFSEDKELLKNLSNHISDIIDNPIIKIKEYSDISEYTKKFSNIRESIIQSLSIFNNIIDRTLNDIEINFIVIYFVAALERMKNLVTDIKILLVCAHGISTSFLVKENLKAIIPNCEIELANSQNYLMKNIENTPDLIFSTIKLGKNMNYLLINPILDFDSIASILKEIDNIKLKKITNSKRKYKSESEKENKIEGLSLSKLIPKKRIRFDVTAKDWKEAIIESAKVLIDEGCIYKGYVDAMIKNVEEHGPYIIISEGIALPHASSEYGIEKTSMSLIKLKEPVKFKNSKEDIKIIICLASKNNEHFLAFMSLINGIRKKTLKEKLMNARNKSEIFEVLLEIEKE